jgi:VanZ family protein
MARQLIPGNPASAGKAGAMRNFALHLLSLGVAAGIAVALLEPVPPALDAASHQVSFPVDKLVHFGLFLVAAFPWRRSFSELGLRKPGIAVVVTAAVYGGLLEVAQGLLPARDAEFADMVAGALGALAGVLILRAIGAIGSIRAIRASKANGASGSRRQAG